MKSRVVISIVLLVVIAAFAWLLLGPSAVKEPVYQGKPLSYWFSDAGYQLTNIHRAQFSSAPKVTDRMIGITLVSSSFLAVRETGTNSIPTLLRLLRAKDSKLKLKLMSLAQKQGLVEINFTPASKLNARAAAASGALGSAASNVVPDLIALFEKTDSGECKVEVLEALTMIGPAGSNAVPAIARAVQSPSLVIQLDAILALGAIHSRLEIALPTLINELPNTNLTVGIMAAFSLGQLGPDAKPAVPELLKFARHPYPPLSSEAEAALRAIDPTAARKAEEK